MPHSKSVVRFKKSHMRARLIDESRSIDSLIAQIEMALLTVGMSLAKRETDDGNKLDG
jgi:hypothetical protein